MKYDPPNYDRPLNLILNDLENKDRSLLVKALLDLLYSELEHRKTLQIYINHIYNDDFWVAKTAVDCIGDLLRIQYADLKQSIPVVLNNLLELKKVKEEMAPVIDATLCDIESLQSRSNVRGNSDHI